MTTTAQLHAAVKKKVAATSKKVILSTAHSPRTATASEKLRRSYRVLKKEIRQINEPKKQLFEA